MGDVTCSAGHVLYPAAIALSRFLELHSDVLLRAETALGRKGKNVLELGAGGGLPGLVAALEGALHVCLHQHLSHLYLFFTGENKLTI